MSSSSEITKILAKAGDTELLLASSTGGAYTAVEGAETYYVEIDDTAPYDEVFTEEDLLVDVDPEDREAVLRGFKKVLVIWPV